MHISKRIFLFLLLSLPLSLFSCSATPSAASLDYRSTSFSAVLCGNRSGKDFSCEAVVQNGRLLSLSYTAPDSLKGLVLTPVEGGVVAEKNGLSVTLPAQTLFGLLAPAHALLPQDFTLHSLQKLEQGSLVKGVCPALPQPLTLTLSSSGFPVALQSGSLSLRVKCRS